MIFDGLNNLGRGSPRKHFCQVILKWIQLFLIFKVFYIQEAHGPRVAHLSDIATADMQMLCNIFPILSSQLMKRSSFKQFLILKKNIYGMPVNGAWSFEQTLNGGQLGFTIGTILVFLIYESPQSFLPSFELTGLSVQKKKRKIDFQDGYYGGNLGYPIGTILAIFHLQVTPMSPNKFGVNWPFGAGEEAKYRFSRSRPWWPSGISDQNHFSYFWSTSHPNASYYVSSQLTFGFRRRSEK